MPADRVRGRTGVRLSLLAVMVAGLVFVMLIKPTSNLVIPLLAAADVMVGFVAAAEPPRRALPAAALTVVVQALATADGSLLDTSLVAVVEILLITIAWLIGNTVRQRRVYATVQREQAETEAVQAERLRIARELHDMIAHSFGVISVQAGMGRRVFDTQPDQARNALATIEETSRETAGALRRLLGSLRSSDPGSGPELREPVPGLADLDALVTRAAHAGVQVSLRRDGDPAPLAPDIDLAAYRIIQESITNVIRHAGTDRCDVVVRHRTGELTVEIIDAGRGGPPQFGYGLSGMRERVSLLGGEFEAGPRTGGGFRIMARLPLPVPASPIP
jgi:signal transduction histidine kinase